ncbi:MAG: sensor histidine kinase [Alphaproteobacteria bacterium]|nr:sensor histidine kinase [Alphaproteobacteria bacterium]
MLDSLLSRFWNRWMAPLGHWLRGRPRLQIELFCLASILLIGALDYWAGLAISLSPLYAAPIAFAAWFVGPESAFVLALFSIVYWVLGEALAGAIYYNWLAPLINCSMRAIFYAFYVVVLARLSRLQLSLEEVAEKRALLLSRETAERERLEREMLGIAEREQRRIGQDLHDGLCQHLTGTALTSQVITERLRRQGHPEAERAQRLVDLVEEAIVLARGMAKGLYPVEMRADGLMQSLEEFAGNTSELFGIACRFVCHSPVLVQDSPTAIHLYRIAQEGVSNAIKHGRATEVTILLEEAENELRLAISDNGGGMATGARGSGLGLRIMADRAKMVGGSFQVGPARPRGTELVCLVPQAAAHG